VTALAAEAAAVVTALAAAESTSIVAAFEAAAVVAATESAAVVVAALAAEAAAVVAATESAAESTSIVAALAAEPAPIVAIAARTRARRRGGVVQGAAARLEALVDRGERRVLGDVGFAVGLARCEVFAVEALGLTGRAARFELLLIHREGRHLLADGVKRARGARAFEVEDDPLGAVLGDRQPDDALDLGLEEGGLRAD